MEHLPMEHLEEARMIAEIWDGVALTTAERHHLDLCTECQHQHAALAQLYVEFEVARQSQVGPEIEARYVALLAQVGQVDPQEQMGSHLLGNLAEWVTALPLWDSRDQTLAVGVRNGNRASYRMLFGTDKTEIELMIEAQNGLLRVVGELMNDVSDGKSGLALVELTSPEGTRIALETVSDDNGRFQLDGVPPGNYTLIITPRYNQILVINPLQLTSYN